MAQKKITDLTLRSSFDATVNVPGDDTSQTWRCTGAQILAYIQAALWPVPLATQVSGTLPIANGGTGATTLTSGGTGNASNPAIASGTGSMSTSGSSNWSSLPAAISVQWMRVGNVVTVSGSFASGATGAGQCQFDLDLPVASTTSSLGQIAGSYHSPTVSTFNGSVHANASSGTKARFKHNATATNFVDFVFSFTYQVI